MVAGSDVFAETDVEVHRSGRAPGVSRPALVVWLVFVVAALLALDLVGLVMWGVVVPGAAVLVWAVVPAARVEGSAEVDRRDLVAVGVLWVAVVGLFWVAFEVFTTDRVAGL